MSFSHEGGKLGTGWYRHLEESNSSRRSAQDMKGPVNPKKKSTITAAFVWFVKVRMNHFFFSLM